jgi:hypothetical protein
MRRRRLCGLLLLVLPLSMWAAPTWYPLGLADRGVNCILADDTNLIVAGTDSGVSVYSNATWYHISMLPAKALVRLSSGVVAAACGNGSRSDGIYIGRALLTRPPYYTFDISNGNWIAEPTAVEVQAIAGSKDTTALLYAGNGTSVVRGAVVKDTLRTLEPLVFPAYAFGVEQPFCAGLHVFSLDSRLYAGGYDGSPMGSSSSLLYLHGDSLYAMRRMKASALVEGRFSSILLSGSLVMAVADVDSGVFFYNPATGSPWRKVSGPTKNPIRSLFVGRDMSGAGNDNELYAVNSDGVYRSTQGEIQLWAEVGNIPADPRCVTGMGIATSDKLLAGTATGVYRYGEQSTHAAGGLPVLAPMRRPVGSAAWFDLRGSRLQRAPAVGAYVIVPGPAANGTVLRRVLPK